MEHRQHASAATESRESADRVVGTSDGPAATIPFNCRVTVKSSDASTATEHRQYRDSGNQYVFNVADAYETPSIDRMADCITEFAEALQVAHGSAANMLTAFGDRVSQECERDLTGTYTGCLQRAHRDMLNTFIDVVVYGDEYGPDQYVSRMADMSRWLAATWVNCAEDAAPSPPSPEKAKSGRPEVTQSEYQRRMNLYGFCHGQPSFVTPTRGARAGDAKPKVNQRHDGNDAPAAKGGPTVPCTGGQVKSKKEQKREKQKGKGKENRGAQLPSALKTQRESATSTPSTSETAPLSGAGGKAQ